MKTISIIILFMMLQQSHVDFRTEQLRNSRVKTAYQEKQKDVQDNLKKHGLDPKKFEVFIRILKKEKLLELWARNRNEKFLLLRTFNICSSSGDPGPKRMVGDYQVPEGFYFINTFNPSSNFYLSLGISYPNHSDRILSKSRNLGGDIFIHGNCVTIGCIPITDDKIKELYIYAVEAKSNGQENIPVHMFPTRLNDEGLKSLKDQYSSNRQLVSFWENLSAGYNYFEKFRDLPKISVRENGLYDFQ